MKAPSIDLYRETLREVVSELPQRPYSWDAKAKDGVSADVVWDGVRLYRKGEPSFYYCVGAVAQATITTLKRMGLEKEIPAEILKKWRKHLFLYAENPVNTRDPLMKGGPGGMVALGLGDFVNMEDVQYGDVCQIWHVHAETGHAIRGHAVIATGKGSRSKGAILENWSASPTMSGIGADWHYLNYSLGEDEKKFDPSRHSKEYNRVIYAARWNFEKIVALKGGER